MARRSEGNCQNVNITIFWYMTSYSFVDKWSYKHFRVTSCLNLLATRICPEDGGSKFLRDVSIKLPKYTASYSRKLIFISTLVRILYMSEYSSFHAFLVFFSFLCMPYIFLISFSYLIIHHKIKQLFLSFTFPCCLLVTPSERVGSPSSGKLSNNHGDTASAARLILHHDAFQTRKLAVPADVKIFVVVWYWVPTLWIGPITR